jgi:hypothetical protein
MTATAGLDVSHRLPPHAGAQRPEVVVHLHRQALLTSPSGARHPAVADLDQLTRVVRAVVEALAPGIVADVSVLDPHSPGAAVRSPQPLPGEHTPDLIGDEHIQLDQVSRTLVVDGVRVMLTRREFEMLAHLAKHRGVAIEPA